MTPETTGSSPWTPLVVVAGALVLAQSSFGAVVEAWYGQLSFAHFLACVASVALFVVGLIVRSSAALLFGVPASLLLIFAAMPSAARDDAFAPERAILWGVSLLGYLCAASMQVAAGAPETVELERSPLTRRRGVGRIDGTTARRGALALALLVVPTLAVIISAPAAHFSASRAAPLALAHMVILFTWLVIVPLFILGPLMDRERVRQASAAGAGTGHQASTVQRIGRWVVSAAWVFAIVLAAGILWALRNAPPAL